MVFPFLYSKSDCYFHSELVSFHVGISGSAFLRRRFIISRRRGLHGLFHVASRPCLALQAFHLPRLQLTEIHLLHVNSAQPSAESIVRYVLLLLWLQYSNFALMTEILSKSRVKCMCFGKNFQKSQYLVLMKHFIC